MRILRVAPWLYPDTKGGGQYHVYAMSRDQAAMGHDVTVVTTKADESLPDREETDGYTVIRVPEGVTVAGNDISPWMARYLWRHAAEYDVVHAHSHLYFSTNLAAMVRRLGDVPLAITNHGLYSQSAPEWVFDVYLRTLGRWTFNQADVVFCYTDTDKNRLRQLGVGSQIEVVPNGIDTERFTPEGATSELIDSDGPVVLFVGRFVEGKRPHIAIEAFAEVLDEYPDAEMYLCGDGPLRAELEAQVRELGIEAAVSFLGHVSYDEMPAVYRSADALVLPSRAEGVPRTMLEAMASGVPVVVSDLEQIADIVSENRWTVSPPEPAEFSGVLCKALASSQTQANAGSSGRDRLCGQHSWSDTVGATTTVLRELTQ